jgi:hypothetical protein
MLNIQTYYLNITSRISLGLAFKFNISLISKFNPSLT